jgi:broad specificity phosphatase PhoE
MTEIWLIRHGQTDWNVTRRMQGQTDIPLNSTGVEQAVELAKNIANEHFDAVYSSDLIRALRTAEILAETLGIQVTTDVRLREICQGVWEGMNMDEVQEKYENEFKRGAHDPAFSRPMGGESVEEVARRMSEAANEIARQFPVGRILLVSHGLAVSTLYCQANHISLTKVYDYIPDNTVPLKIEWKSV